MYARLVNLNISSGKIKIKFIHPNIWGHIWTKKRWKDYITADNLLPVQERQGVDRHTETMNHIHCGAWLTHTAMELEDIMASISIDKESCKACGYCVKFCPKKALSFSEELNSQSYTYVVIDEEKCIYCGTCYQVCPDMVFEIQ